MTTQEKAKQLVNKFIVEGCLFANAKKCALICADEVLSQHPTYVYWDTYDDETPSAVTFWNEVKTEIEKI